MPGLHNPQAALAFHLPFIYVFNSSYLCLCHADSARITSIPIEHLIEHYNTPQNITATAYPTVYEYPAQNRQCYEKTKEPLSAWTF